MKKTAFGVLGFVAAIAFYTACSAAGGFGLSQQGLMCLAILLWAIFWWIGGILPEYATGILMVIGFTIFAGVDTSVSFAAFTSSTWWLLFAAFALGAGMKISGLMERMALGIIRIFPNTFIAQAAALMAAGTLVGPFIPSMSAKAAMLAPIAMGMGDAMGYPRKGRRMQGLFAAMISGVRTIGPAVISASVLGYAIWGLMPEDVQARFDMVHWFIASLPWFVPCLALTFLAIAVLYGPRKGEREIGSRPEAAGVAPAASSPAASSAADSGSVSSGADPSLDRNLGPMSLHEKEMLAIMAATVILWITEPLHGIASHVVALAALVAMVACGILGKANFRKDISWESLIFVGIVIGLASVFGAAGIEEWIVEATGPVFQSLAANSYLFILGIGVFTILLRFVIVSEMAYVNIFLVFMVPLAVSAGINPWIVGMAVYCTVNPWFVLYQNPIYLAGFYSVDGEMVRHADMARFCAVYQAICLVSLMIATPFWQMMGLL